MYSPSDTHSSSSSHGTIIISDSAGLSPSVVVVLSDNKGRGEDEVAATPPPRMYSPHALPGSPPRVYSPHTPQGLLLGCTLPIPPRVSS